MADTPSTILLTREQSTGSNTNLWGGYLITTQRITEQASKGYQTLAVTADATITWTNYTTANTGQCAHLKLTGTLSAAVTLTFPAYMNRMLVNNQAGAQVTIKCAAGTGVAIPNSRRCVIRCDGSDYTTDTATYTADTVTLANGGDLVTYTALTTALTTLVAGTITGLVLNSASDTTKAYLGQKISVSGALTKTTTSPAGNEVLALAVGALGLTDGGLQNASFSAAVNTSYACSVGGTITLPAATGSRNKIAVAIIGAGVTTLSGTVNGASSFVVDGDQTVLITDAETTRGWV